MKIREVISYLESIASPSLQENYDNAGLVIGDAEVECAGIICSLDATEEVVLEAIEKKCNLIVTHHPIIFSGLRKITGNSYVDKTVITAIRNDIAIYAIHTNLDNVIDGVNGKIASVLGLKNKQILSPKDGTLKKLYTFVPTSHVENVRAAIFHAGAGTINNYSECSFNTQGEGTFKAQTGANPYIGKIGERHSGDEWKIEAIFPAYLEIAVIKAMMAAHPYEEVAYDVVNLANSHSGIGAGMVGELEKSQSENEFLHTLKDLFSLSAIRHSKFTGKQVSKVALCGGAGSFLITKALRAGADVFVTADLKYHEFFDANGSILLCDIGHYESEQFTIDLLQDRIAQKFPTFAVQKTAVQTNPVYYF